MIESIYLHLNRSDLNISFKYIIKSIYIIFTEVSDIAFIKIGFK